MRTRGKRREIDPFSKSGACGELQAVHSGRAGGSRKCPCVDSCLRVGRLNGAKVPSVVVLQRAPLTRTAPDLPSC